MAKSTQGYSIQFDVESALGTAGGSPYYVKLAGEPTLPTTVDQVVDTGVKGYSHFGGQDKPTTFEAVVESGITLPMHILRSELSGEAPSLAAVFESAGMNQTIEDDDTAKTAGTHTVNQHELTTGPTGNGYGACYLTYDETAGIWWPSICASYNPATPDIVKWMYQLANAPSDGDPVCQMYSFNPASGPVDAAKTLQMFFNTRQTYTSGDDWMYTFAGCACSSLGTLEIVPNQVPVLSPTFHVADVSRSADTLGIDTFQDSQVKQVAGGKFFAAIGEAKSFSEYALAGVARSNEIILTKATIDFGISVMPIPGIGSTTLNNVQGYIAQYDPAAAQLTIERVMPSVYSGSQIANWDSDSTSEYAIQIVQGVSGTNTDPTAPCYGFFAPRCHLKTEPVHVPFGDAYHKVTETYAFTPSSFLATAFDERNAPYHFAIYTPSA